MDAEGGTSNAKPVIEDVDEFCKNSLGALMQVVRASHKLPSAGDDYEFYSSFSGFRDFVNYQKERLLKHIGSLMKNNGLKESFAGGSSKLFDVDELTDKLVESNDGILERVSALLDECDGKRKPQENDATSDSTPLKNPIPAASPKTIVSSWNKKDKAGKNVTFRLLHAHNILRPQLKFKDKIDNSTAPFVPKIRSKLNAQRPLSKSLLELQNLGGNDTSLAITSLLRQARQAKSEDMSIYEHPYQYELETWEPLPKQLEKVEPVKYSDLDQDSCIFVETSEQLNELLTDLNACSEFAIDLENHSYRSFQGLTCLMQLSTRSQDYIVDVLALRFELHVLNEPFTNPNIVKVLHGADFDVLWLQRDFGLYLVNMFDTGQASRALNMPRFSLDFLTSHYCEVNLDKKYQLADWRIRPLPKEMLYYAQCDTHYLLYIHDVMKNQLLDASNEESDLLLQVLEKSRDLCLRRYEKPTILPESHLLLIERQRRKSGGRMKILSPQQTEALRLLYSWRDSLARQEDESAGYVLPNHMLLQISEILPREAQGVLACCNPIPPLLRQNVLAVHQLVTEARFKMIFPSTSSVTNATSKDPDPVIPVTPAKLEFTYGDLLTCPHDLSHFGSSAKDAEAKKKERKSSVISEERSSLLGPFDVKSPSPQRLPVFRKDSTSIAVAPTTPKNGALQEKLENIQKIDSWDPFLLFMLNSTTGGGERGGGKKRTHSEGADVDRPLSLKQMLSGDFTWKMRRLEGADAEKPEDKEDEKPKKFGTVVDIPEEAKRDTGEQIQVLRKMMQGKGGKKTKKHSHSASAPALTFAKLDKNVEKSPNFPDKDSNAAEKQQKRPFVPHIYTDEDYKRFQKKEKKKRKFKY